MTCWPIRSSGLRPEINERYRSPSAYLDTPAGVPKWQQAIGCNRPVPEFGGPFDTKGSQRPRPQLSAERAPDPLERLTAARVTTPMIVALPPAITRLAHGNGSMGCVRRSPAGTCHCADQRRWTKGASAADGSNQRSIRSSGRTSDLRSPLTGDVAPNSTGIASASELHSMTSRWLTHRRTRQMGSPLSLGSRHNILASLLRAVQWLLASSSGDEMAARRDGSRQPRGGAPLRQASAASTSAVLRTRPSRGKMRSTANICISAAGAFMASSASTRA